MKQLRVVLADKDSFYLKQLTNYLLKTPQGFEVLAFTEQEGLERFLQSGEPADILLIAEEMRSEITDQSAIAGHFLLAEQDGTAPEGYVCVPKYQRMSTLIDDVMLDYARRSGRLDRMTGGGRSARLIGVWSPAGGSGKTTLALLLSHQAGLAGKKVLYQNCERLDSSRSVLPQKARAGLSEILVELRSGEAGVGLSMASKACADEELAFSYLNAADSSMELNEFTAEEQRALFSEVAETGRFDLVLLDFDSELNSNKLQMLSLCDRVLIPFLPDQLGLAKLDRLFCEAELHGDIRAVVDKAVFAANKLEPHAERYLQAQPVLGKCGGAEHIPLNGQAANPAEAIRGRPEMELCLQRLLDRLLAD